MFLKEYDDRDGLKVWLDEEETQLLIDRASGQRWVAIMLGVRSGLRVSEIIEVRPKDVVLTSAGPRVRVWEGKGDTYRETPAPTELYQRVESTVSLSDKDPEEPVITTDHTRTVRQWVYDLGEQLAEETGDEGWHHLGPHDLRRSWATAMSGYRVNPLLVCEWGGWDDLETFLDHYHGIYSPDVQRRELGRVPWMDAERGTDDARDPELTLLNDTPEIPVSTTPSSGIQPRG